MMLSLWIVTLSLVMTSFGADVQFSFENHCYEKGNSMTISAKYTGTETVIAVQWYYSGQLASNLVVAAGSCSVFGTVDTGYPNTTRMSFTCPPPTNTFTLTLEDLNEDELDKSWGATFTLSGVLSPSIEQDKIIVCVATITSTTSTTTSSTPTTTSTRPTTTSTTFTTSTTPTTTISTPATSTTTVDNSSDSKLEVIIVSSVVGGLIVVGIAIAALFIFHQQRNKKHTTRNQSYVGRDHHKQYKKSKSPYQQKYYNYLYNGRSHNGRGQVIENPLNRVSKEKSLSRSYYTGASSRYDNYRPAYTVEHVYPSDTSGHRFMSEYIGENRNPKNSKHSSYPGYSMGNMRYTDNKVLYY